MKHLLTWKLSAPKFKNHCLHPTNQNQRFIRYLLYPLLALFLLNVASAQNSGCYSIDWETDGDGNAILAGQYVTSTIYSGIGVTVTNNLDPANPLVIFDSDSPTGGDEDLGSPSMNCPTCTSPCPGISQDPNGGLTLFENRLFHDKNKPELC